MKRSSRAAHRPRVVVGRGGQLGRRGAKEDLPGHRARVPDRERVDGGRAFRFFCRSILLYSTARIETKENTVQFNGADELKPRQHRVDRRYDVR
jgi:hypothetical protein